MEQLSDIKTILVIVVGICTIGAYLWKIARDIPRKKALKLILERFPQTFDDEMRTTRTKLQNSDNLAAHIKHVVAETTLKRLEANRDYYDFLKTRAGLLYGHIPMALVGLFVIAFLFATVLTFTIVWGGLPEHLKNVSATVEAAQMTAYARENNLLSQLAILGWVPTVAALLVSAIAHALIVHVQVVRGSLRIFRTAGIAKVAFGKITEIIDADDDPVFKDVVP